MATFETAQTPPPRSPSSLSSSLPAAQNRSPYNTSFTHRAQVSFSQDDLSSSDKENSPGNAYISRNSLNMTANSEDKPVSFTPRRVRPLPRAWERRPATPFVPRNEGQKIWKRIPLSDLAAEGNVGSNIRESRDDKSNKSDYVRIVKRLKVEPGGQDADATNGYLGTKEEEDNIEKGGSPKKKAGFASIYIQSQLSTETTLDREFHTEEIGKNEKSLTPPQPENSSAILGLQDYEESVALIAPENDDVTDKQASEAVIQLENTAAIRKFQNSGHESDIGVLSSAQIESNTGGEDKHELESTLDETSPDDSKVTSTSISIHSSLHEQAGDVLFGENITSPEQITHDDNIEVEQETPEKGQMIIFEHIETRASSPAIDLPATEVTRKSPVDAADMPVSTRSMTTFVGGDQEDTTFLHQFLLRARASKAARNTTDSFKSLSNVGDHADMVSEIHKVSHDPLMSDDIEDREFSSPVKSNSVQEVTTDDEDKSLSPVRRSARTASRSNTRLPRPQNLPPVPQFGPILPSQNLPFPNTIQLKRATGTEFIFSAKMQQTLAMTTRSNTKRNQGPAVSVTVRLAQMQAERLVEGGGQIDSETPSVSQTTLISVDFPSPVKANPSKKRKRTKEPAGHSTKKSVRWNEELTSYQEPCPASPESKPTSNDFAEIEAAAQAEALQSMTDSFSFSIQPDPDTSDGNSKPWTIQQVSDLAVKPDTNVSSDTPRLGVRRLRKVNVGNVNGTPAPKTRSQSSQQISKQSSIPKMGSRMPLATTTSISKSIVTTSTKKQNSVEDIKTTEDSKMKITGRRSLRGRS